MLIRHIVLPTTEDELWEALTDPEALAGWFGAEVEWDLRPGGRATFLHADGTRRNGEVDVVDPGRQLSFRWWPAEEAGGEGEEDGRPSRVTYTLHPDEGGTRLTVTENPLPVTLACAATDEGAWTGWDARLFRYWASASDRLALVASARR